MFVNTKRDIDASGAKYLFVSVTWTAMFPLKKTLYLDGLMESR